MWESEEIGILHLPPEVLQQIFAFYIQGQHQSALLNIIANVCTYFRKVCLQPCMWKAIDASVSVQQLKCLSAAGALKCTRKLHFSTYRQLSNDELDEIFSGLPRLESINFGYLLDVKESYFQAVLKSCPVVKEIDFSKDVKLANDKYPNILDGIYLYNFLKIKGENITSINLSHCRIISQTVLFKALPQCCQNLEEFVVLDSGNVALRFPLNAFQNHCGKLRILLLDGVIRFEKNSSVDGFPELENFTFKCGELTRRDYVELLKALNKSTKLKALDVRACRCLDIWLLLRIPTWKLEYLNISSLNLHSVTMLMQILSKWSDSLKVLDISWTTLDINEVILFVASFPNLEKLSLKGTSVSADAVRKLIMVSETLKELELWACSNLSDNLKCAYYGRHELQTLLSVLSNDPHL